MNLLLAHIVMLAWLSLGAAARWTDDKVDLFLSAGAIAWANLLTTTALLQVFAPQSRPGVLLAVSAGLAALGLLAAWRLPALILAGEAPVLPNPWLLTGAVLTLGLLGVQRRLGFEVSAN